MFQITSHHLCETHKSSSRNVAKFNLSHLLTRWHSFFQLIANRRHNPQNRSSPPSSQCNRNNTQGGKQSQPQPPQGPDNAKMERMKHISAAQNELYDRILTQYYMPLQLYIKAKDPKTVTLAEHTRLYKLGKLMETLSLSCQVGFVVNLLSDHSIRKPLDWAATPLGGLSIGRPLHWAVSPLGGLSAGRPLHWSATPLGGYSIGWSVSGGHS